MAENEDLNKSEQATPFKREEARKHGNVPKSADFAGWVLLAVGSVVLIATAKELAGAMADATARQLVAAGQVPDVSAVGVGAQLAVVQLTSAAGPLVLALLIAAVLGTMLQTGPVFSTHPLAPDFSRLDPAKGLEKLFSRRTLFEAFKLMLKLGVLALALYWLLERVLTVVGTLGAGSAPALANRMLDLSARSAMELLALLAVIAFGDLVYSRREYDRKLMMSSREVRDEHKRREGSPEVKQRRRRFMFELLRRAAALRQVKGSDVIVTNPTHVAVALRYRPDTELAPVVAASGSGLLADRIRGLATRHGVPIVRRPELARALYAKSRVGDAIPESAYLGVAAIYRDLAAARRTAAAPALPAGAGA